MSKRSFVVMALLLVILSLGAGSVMADDAPVCEPGEGAHAAFGNMLSDGVKAWNFLKNSSNCDYVGGIAVYEKYEEYDESRPETLNSQRLFASQIVTVPAGGEVYVEVPLPACASQVDLFWGNVITDFTAEGTYGNRLIVAGHFGSELCGTPTPTPPPPTPTPPPPTPTPPPPADPTWCSPGYWRQPHHLDSWAATGISPDAKYSAYFGPVTLSNNGARRRASADPTLWEVLQSPQFYGGAAFNNVGDLLSGAHPDVNFNGTRVEDSCPLN
ncbi:MAG: hypothetical protein ACOCXR_03200 [Phototrophicaceae bacterium]